MAEERTDEEEQEESNIHTPPPSPGHPLSPNPRKRLSSPPSLPSKKKTKDLLPSLSNCHSCGHHFPSKSQTQTNLQILDSQWRIVLLCDECLCQIKSAAKCSYCFSDITGSGYFFLDCCQCSCRVHVSCIPTQRSFVSPSDLDPESFNCVDCCALLRPRNRNPNSCFAKVSVEDLVREAKKKASVAARAKEKALEKAEVAKRAAEWARKALDDVIMAKERIVRSNSVVKDEELALKLHRAMNGSQRIVRSGRSTSLDCLVDLKKVRGGNGESRSCEKVEFCTEDMGLFEPWSSSIGLDCIGEKEQKDRVGRSESISLVEMLVKEERESFSDKVVNSSGEDSSVGSVLISCQRAIESNGIIVVNSSGEISSESQQKKRCGSPDRYMKKYSKRKSLNEMMNKESRLVSCWQTSCAKTSTFSDAPFSSLSGCQS